MRRIEVELWFRDSGASRDAAFRRVADVGAEADGAIIDHSVIEEIGYEGALIDLPAPDSATSTFSGEGPCAYIDDVLFAATRRTSNLGELPTRLIIVTVVVRKPRRPDVRDPSLARKKLSCTAPRR